MFSTMKKKKIPKLLLTTIVKTDGLGDLSHFFDIDNYFATSDEVGEHDCERVVVCYKKNKEITIKRMKENGYQIIEFDENGHSLTEIDPNKKQVHLIVLDYVGDNTKINPFFEQHKELTAGLNYAISVSTNLFESEFITVNDFNKYFTPKNQPTYICCTEHYGKIGYYDKQFAYIDSKPVTNGLEKVIPWGMGFCAEEYGIKIEPRSDVNIEAALQTLHDEKLKVFLEKLKISSEKTIIIPCYFKSPQSARIFVKSILKSSLLKDKQVLFCFSGLPREQADIILEDCEIVTEKNISNDFTSNKPMALCNYPLDDNDYSIVQQLAGKAGCVGACSGDISFEKMVSLMLLPFYEIPFWKIGFIRSLMRVLHNLNKDNKYQSLIDFVQLQYDLYNHERIQNIGLPDWRISSSEESAVIDQLAKAFNEETLALWREFVLYLFENENYYDSLPLLLKQHAKKLHCAYQEDPEENVEDVAMEESMEEERPESHIGKSEISSEKVVEVRNVGKEEMEQDDKKPQIKARQTDEQELINFSKAIHKLKNDPTLQMVRKGHFIVIAVNNSTGPFYVIDDTKLKGKGCFGSAYLTYLVDENDNINIKESEENLYVTKIISKGEFDAIAFESKCFNKKSGPSEPPIRNYDNLLIVSKYFPGFDLSSDETSPEVKALSFTDTANLLAQLAMAINLIHHHTASTGTGIFHGDIKGENIRVNIVESGNGFHRIDVTLLDYGFSVKIQGSAITEEGIRKLQGTPVYLAPELHFVMGGIKSDIRSLVPVVLRLLRAIHPFEYKHSATNQLDYLYAKYDFSGIFTDMFKTPLFFFNGKCMDEQLKRLIIKFIEKMQHDDYGERPDSDEFLQFFLALSNFCKTYQSLSANFTRAPTLPECSQLNPFLAKLTILSEGLWYHAIEPKTIANSQPDTFIKTFADYDFEALDTVARLIEPEMKKAKNAIGLDLNAMQQVEKAPPAAQENTKLTDIAFSKINSEIENYLGKSARFRNKQLLFYKQTLAEIFIANIEKNKSPLAIKNNLRTLQDLNYIFEELSDEKNQGIFPEQMDKETVKLLTTQLFNLIVAKGRDISAMDIFKAFHDQKDLIHLPFHFAIFHKLAEIAVRNSKEGYGKFYRPLFSSRLGTIVIKIKDIIDKEDSFERQINQAAM